MSNVLSAYRAIESPSITQQSLSTASPSKRPTLTLPTRVTSSTTRTSITCLFHPTSISSWAMIAYAALIQEIGDLCHETTLSGVPLLSTGHFMRITTASSPTSHRSMPMSTCPEVPPTTRMTGSLPVEQICSCCC